MHHPLLFVTLVSVAILAIAAVCQAGGVVDPHVSTDRSVDYTSVDRIIQSLVSEDMTDEEKVLAVFHAMRRLWVHGPTPKDLRWDFHTINHSVGTGACLTMTTPLQVVYKRMGYKSRSWVHDGHHMMEVFYGGQWHCLDPHMTFYCYDRSEPRQIASVE